MGTSTARPGRRASLQRRGIQLGLVVVAVALVVVVDGIAAAVGVLEPGPDARRLQALLVVGARVVAGWAVGLTFRLQLAPSARPDEQLRLLLGAPLGFLCAWPLLLTYLPGALRRMLPSWLVGGPVLEVQPLVAVIFGLVLALAVTGRRGR